jgi:dATP pyrophosphohydrolase
LPVTITRQDWNCPQSGTSETIANKKVVLTGGPLRGPPAAHPRRSEHEEIRAPFQILVIPFRHRATGIEFAVLKRSDAGWWQFVAGGGEGGESPAQAAARETEEEIGVNADGRLMALDSKATVPKNCFAAADSWGPDVYVVPEYCFAVDISDRVLALSGEHTELQWLPYEAATAMLKWDSNRNALWELNERLKKTSNQASHAIAAKRGSA